jgi:rubrerythrin
MKKFSNVREAIETAIQMEKDGYAFYNKAAAQTSSDMGRSVFESLANDELVHLDVFQKLFDDKFGESEWDDLVNSNKKYREMPIFPKDLKTIEGINLDTDELDALRIAIDSEKEAIDYYMEIRANSDDDNVKKIIDMIIEQEKKHYFLLEQEFHHINTTGYWFELDYLGT